MENRNYPSPLVRVTGGMGGESVLILGSEKTALHDLGMACFSEELIKNIQTALDGRSLDYVLLSHTHYDHMGALPYVIRRWPNVKVCGSEKAAQVFSRKGALDMIVSMGRTTAEFYGKDPDKVSTDGVRIDIVLRNCDTIDLGDAQIVAYETKGHTDCSMSYFLQPQGIILASESTGVLMENNLMHTSVLKSFEDSFSAAALLKSLPYKEILVPHYGMVPGEMLTGYFDLYIAEAIKERNLIASLIKSGLTADEIFEEHKKVYWTEDRAKEHPFRAYKMNTEIIIKRMMKDAGK